MEQEAKLGTEKYYVYSEGYRLYDDFDNEAYGGRLTLETSEYVEYTPYGGTEKIRDWDVTDNETEYITSKWGGAVVNGVVDGEFGNGVVHHYEGEDYQEAQAVFDALIDGEIEFTELELL